MNARPRESSESGSVLLVTLVLMIAFGGLASASLSMTVSETKKLTTRHYARQVRLLAQGELEVAKNMVNASQYDTNLQNKVLLLALASPNQVIPNTNVRVERVETTKYFVLRSQATQHGITKSAEAIVRQVSPASSNNLMVIDHPVGVSGAPRGAIHSNKWIDFYFPGGNYRDQVTATGGFNFLAGANVGNTTFTGASNPNAALVDPLKNVDFDSLWSEADTLAITDNLISEITFMGDKAEIKLYRPAYEEEVPATRTKTVFDHYEAESYTVNEPIYETVTYYTDEPVYITEYYTVIETKPVYAWRTATRVVQEPIYEDQTVNYTVDVPIYSTRTIQVQEWIDEWVSYSTEDGPSSSGGTVGSTGSLTGYWKKVQITKDVQEQYISGFTQESRTRIDRVWVGTNDITETYEERYIDSWEDVSREKKRKIQDGTIQVSHTRQDIIGYTPVVKERQVKVYVEVIEDYLKTVKHAETIERTEVVDSQGVIYLKGDVRKISGQMDGRVSLITSGSVMVTGDLQYVDADGDTRMANGKDHTQPYVENPDYDGDSLLAIMAKGDIVYSKDAPPELEVNASLISADGSVKFEGIGVSVDGADVWSEHSEYQVLTSIRRLGGIVSRKRPIATYINEKGYIAAGFEFGESIMDQNLILSSGTNAPPPFMFESAVPTWIMSTAGLRMGVQ
jgi:hypothetical protein